MSFSLSESIKIDVGWGFAQTPVIELTAFPQSLSWFQGGRFTAGEEWKRGKGRTRGREEGKGGEWGNEKWRGKGEVGGIAPWLLGG